MSIIDSSHTFISYITHTHTHTLGPSGSTSGGVVYTTWGKTTCSNISGAEYCMLEGQLEAGGVNKEEEQLSLSTRAARELYLHGWVTGRKSTPVWD